MLEVRIEHSDVLAFGVRHAFHHGARQIALILLPG